MESKLYTHINEWPWGTTVTLVCNGGVGTVDMSFEKNNPGVCYLSGLSVLPDFRRQYIGLSLMNECFSFCKQEGIFRVDLNSVQEDWLMGFYHRLGFKDIEENEGFMRMYKMLR